MYWGQLMPNATIQKIESISPIEGADQILKARILGWDVVVRKNDFQPGDLCVLVEIDSEVPKNSWSEFLFKSPHENDPYARIKTKKLRGVLSQGLALPLSIVPATLSDGNAITLAGPGQDLSEVLGVRHYEKPEQLRTGGIRLGNFPPYVPKTGETNIQSCLTCLDELKGQRAVSTIKCDGTSFSAVYKDGEMSFCSHKNKFDPERLENQDVIYVKIAKKHDLAVKLGNLKLNIAIQGEVCGPGIQKNRMALSNLELFVFDVWDIDKQVYWDNQEVGKLCKTLNLETVPPSCTWINFNLSLNELLELAKGYYPNTKNRKEGIVVRADPSMQSQKLRGRLSFKVVNNDYLLKEEE